MPAVNRSNGSHMKFYNVFRGKFTLKAPDDYKGPDLVERINADNKAVREIHYNRLEGLILVDIKEEHHDEYGKSYNFFFMDGNEYIKLKVSTGSVASGILLRLENIIIDESLDIELYFFPKDDKNPKDKVTLNIFQREAKVQRVYTKDNSGKLPQPVQEEFNGKKAWNWTDQLNYWTEVIKSIVAVLPGVHQETAEVAQEQDTAPPTQTPAAAPTQSSPPLTQEDEEDDLPF